MSLDRTRTRTIRPLLNPAQPGATVKFAKPTQRLIANIFDAVIFALAIYNTYKFFNVPGLFPKSAARHHFIIVSFYYYFFLTIFPHYFFGQSMGQALTGIKVMSVTFKKLGFFATLFRDLLRPTTLILPSPVFSQRHRAWYDSWLKTSVMDVR